MGAAVAPGFEELAQATTDLNGLDCVLGWALVTAAELQTCKQNERFIKTVFKSSDRWQQAGRKRLALPLKEGGFNRTVQFLKGVSLQELLVDAVKQKWARECWTLVSVYACNAMFGYSRPLSHGPWNKLERRCIEAIGGAVDRLLCHGSETLMFDNAKEKKLKSVRINYQGEEVGICHQLSLEQILPALPPPEHGGVIDTLEFVGPQTRHWLQHPEDLLIKDDGRELPKLNAKIHIAPGEIDGIAQELVKRGVCGWIPYEDVGVYRGTKILNGLFGVEKSAKTDSGKTVLRLIMNLVPSNSVFKQIRGAVDRLPSITCWMSSVVQDGQELRLWQSDMSNAFYLFRIPEQWMPYLSFGVFTDGANIGKTAGKKFALSCRVLPMGWGSSVAVMQEVSEKILHIGGLDPSGQLVRQRAVPHWMVGIVSQGKKEGRAWWHVYLDNFCAGEITEQGNVDLDGDLVHERAEQAWAEAQVISSAKKRKRAEIAGHELGAFLDGEAKYMGGSAERFIKLAHSTLYALGQPFLSKKVCQVLGGRWIHVMQFRRPCMSALNAVWELVGDKGIRQAIHDEVRREFFISLCLIPLMHTNLGATISESMTASDASTQGGAVGISRGLTDVGKDFVRSQLALKSDEGCIPVLLISLFNGIGGCMRCYDVLGLRPVKIVSFDWHGPANRVVSRRWPHVEIHLDVKTFTEEVAREILSSATGITEVHLWWGFPCTDLSSAKAFRDGLKGKASGLFFEGLRIRKIWKRLCGNRLRFKETVENVASMDKDHREEISAKLGVFPYFLDCYDAVPMHRPRLCWTTESLEYVLEGVSLEQQENWIRVWAPGAYPELTDWVEDNSEWPGGKDGHVLPTCMKAIKRERPPIRPAGINRCNSAALARYHADDFRYPPYHYLDQFVFYTERGTWRLVSEVEKELLLGYGWGHTSLCLSASDIKQNPQRYKDERNSLLGDSFSVVSFVIVAAAMCRNFLGNIPYTHLLHRLGMAPGYRMPIRWIAPIQKRLCFGRANQTSEVTTQQLNRLLLARVNHTGSDIKIASGEVLNPKAFPRQSLDPELLAWEICFKTKWHFKAHINVLELRSIFQAVQYHIARLGAFNQRIFHISDSYVCISIIGKGRTGSKQLQAVLKQLNALLLCHGLVLVLGHVDSTVNPTDGASRALEDSRKKNSSWTAQSTQKHQLEGCWHLTKNSGTILPSLADAFASFGRRRDPFWIGPCNNSLDSDTMGRWKQFTYCLWRPVCSPPLWALDKEGRPWILEVICYLEEVGIPS